MVLGTMHVWAEREEGRWQKGGAGGTLHAEWARRVRERSITECGGRERDKGRVVRACVCCCCCCCCCLLLCVRVVSLVADVGGNACHSLFFLFAVLRATALAPGGGITEEKRYAENKRRAKGEKRSSRWSENGSRTSAAQRVLHAAARRCAAAESAARRCAAAGALRGRSAARAAGVRRGPQWGPGHRSAARSCAPLRAAGVLRTAQGQPAPD